MRNNQNSIHCGIESNTIKKLILVYQFGLRTNCLSDSCLAQLADFGDALTGMNTKIHTFMILVDLQMTFDILDHGILHEQVRCLVFGISEIKWFESNLLNKILLEELDGSSHIFKIRYY